MNAGRALKRYGRLIHTAFFSLRMHKLRSFLSVLGVICGIAAVMVMISIGEGAKKEILAQIEQLGTRNIYIKTASLTEEQSVIASEKRSPGLNLSDADRVVTGCNYVEDIAVLREIRAAPIGMKGSVIPLIVGSSPNYARIHNLVIAEGRFISDQDVAEKSQVCVLGDTVARSLGTSGSLGGYLRIEDHLFRIVGILDKFDRRKGKSAVVSVRDYNDMILLPLSVSGAVHRSLFEDDQLFLPVTELIVRISSSENVMKSVPVIRRILEVSHGGVEDYHMVIPQELLRQSTRAQRTFNFILGSIAAISLLVGGIGIMNIMLVNVAERTREIGLRRALGATKKHIINHFMAEAVILTFIGGLFGICAGVFGVLAVSFLAGWATVINLWAVLLPLSLSVLVGIFFGLYPAYNAANLDPIAALRHE